MTTREVIAKRIMDLCFERGITPNKLSSISAVPQATIKSILNGESKNPGAITLKKFVTDLRSRWENFSVLLNLIHWNRKSNN